MSDDETPGERLRRARMRAGLSQKALAQELGVTKYRVMRWESGEYEWTGTHLYAMARLLGTSPDWLQTGKGLPPAHTSAALKKFLASHGQELPDDCKAWLATVQTPPGVQPTPTYWRNLVAAWWAGERRPDHAAKSAILHTIADDRQSDD